MRIALIADIHGNLPALESVLQDIQKESPDQIVCLGDIAAMGPFPVETLERVRDLDCTVIMGNGDAAAIEPPEPSDGSDALKRFAEMDRWSAQQLSADHREFIQTFRSTARFDLPGERSLLCFHGSPRSYHDVISATTPDEDVGEMLNGERATIMAGGHWHFQMLRRYKGMTLFNPGSVGLPYDADAEGNIFLPSRAEFGIITVEPEKIQFEHRRIDYDVQPFLTAMKERGFPHAEWSSGHWR